MNSCIFLAWSQHCVYMHYNNIQKDTSFLACLSKSQWFYARNFIALRLTEEWWFISAFSKEPQMTSWLKWVSHIYHLYWHICIRIVIPLCLLLRPPPFLHPVSTLLNLRLSESDSGKMVSVLDLPGSLLIVPQATLGGKAKGRAMQYHNNIGKEDGLRLYCDFVLLCEKELMATASGMTVKHGTYGNRQVLKLDTNGPYTHLMEFWAAKKCEARV